MAPREVRPAVSEASRGDPAAPSSTRDRILDAALDLFIKKGYAEASLRELAAELGFSKAALYYHFQSKQDILLALHMRVHHITDDLLPLLEAKADRQEQWERILDALIGLAPRHRKLIELHIRNQDAIADLHVQPTLARHGVVESEMEGQLAGLLRDDALPLEKRIRRTASLGAIAGVLLSADAFEEVPDAELEALLRVVIADVLGSDRSAGPGGNPTRADSAGSRRRPGPQRKKGARRRRLAE